MHVKEFEEVWLHGVNDHTRAVLVAKRPASDMDGGVELRSVKGDAAAKSERRHAWKRAELVSQGTEVALLLLGTCVVFAAKRYSESERPRSIEAPRRVLKAHKAREKKIGAKEQHQRERDFQSDKYVASLVLAAAGGKAARTFSQSVVDIDARREKCRHDTHQQSGGDRNADDKEKHASVEVGR